MCTCCLWEKKIVFNPANYLCPVFEDCNFVNKTQLPLTFSWKAWLLVTYCFSI